MIFSSLFDRLFSIEPRLVVRLRLLCAVFCATLTPIMFTPFLAPGTRSTTILSMSASCEISFVCVFFAFFMSNLSEFRRLSFVLVVHDPLVPTTEFEVSDYLLTKSVDT
jgi:hypothetical protein